MRARVVLAHADDSAVWAVPGGHVHGACGLVWQQLHAVSCQHVPSADGAVQCGQLHRLPLQRAQQPCWQRLAAGLHLCQLHLLCSGHVLVLGRLCELLCGHVQPCARRRGPRCLRALPARSVSASVFVFVFVSVSMSFCVFVCVFFCVCSCVFVLTVCVCFVCVLMDAVCDSVCCML